MQYILSLAVSFIPLLAISFVTALILFKLYVKIRSNFKVNVNCWFCNTNSKVPYLEANCFTCPKCEQYNGFTKDGGYNREIYEQLDCSNLSAVRRGDVPHDLSGYSEQIPGNGFCHVCNEGQRLKIEKLAQFEPKNESRFEEELKSYKNKLEEQYRLCTTCDRHLKRVLREKKKLVLGSKFLDFIIKGAENFKKPHFERIKNAEKSKLKLKISTIIAVLATMNAFCIVKELPDLTRDTVINILGVKFGHYTFMMLSHVLALLRVLSSYSEMLSSHQTVQKLCLFLKTITMMVFYSMGMKLPQVAALNMTSILILVNPFLMLSLAFIYNFVDGFKLSRFTLMLTLWSLCAGGILDYKQIISSRDFILLLISVITVYMSLSAKSEANLVSEDDTSRSFHKIYSEDGFSDEDTRETISLLSQKLNSSANSMLSGRSERSFMSQSCLSALNGGRLVRSPITSSVLSLNGCQSQRSPPFKSFCRDEEPSLSRNHIYDNSKRTFPTNRPLFASNLELNCTRPQSTFGANASFNSPLAMNVTMAQYNDDVNNIFQKTNHAPMRYATTPLTSPFSVSTSAVYQRSNLLTPSHFSTNSLATKNPSASWLSGGYFNSGLVDTAEQSPTEKQNFFTEHRNGMTAIQENMSRASSQSSGFESQSSSNVKDYSICPEQEHYPHVATSISDCHNGFYPIDNSGLFQRPSSILNASFQTPMASPVGSLCGFSSAASNHVNHNLPPLVVNCNQDYWKPPKAQPNTSISNAFNLRKINEELPPIQRGALLKKWKENQVQS